MYLFSVLGDKKKEIKKSTTKRESQRLNKPCQLMPQDFDNEVMMQHVHENNIFFLLYGKSRNMILKIVCIAKLYSAKFWSVPKSLTAQQVPGFN